MIDQVPTLPPVDGMVAGGQTETSRRTSAQTSTAREARPTTAASRIHSSPVRAASARDRASPSHGHTAARPARTASTGSVAISTIAAYATSHAGRLSGRASPQGPRARPVRRAGRRPRLAGRDLPEDGRTGARLGAGPDRGARAEHAATPTRPHPPPRAPGAGRLPSSQCPLRSTSGSMEHSSPSVSIPVTGGIACRSTCLPTLPPGAGRRGAPRARRRCWMHPSRRPAARRPRHAHAPAHRADTPRADPLQQQPGSQHRDQHAPWWRDEQQPPDRDRPPRRSRQPGRAEPGGRSGVARRDPGDPAQPGQRAERDRERDLADLGLQRHWNDTPVRGRGGRCHLVESLCHCSQGGLLVDVGHGRLGNCSRSRETRWAAARLPPPTSKKSSERSVTTAPRISSQSCWSQAAVPLSCSGSARVAPSVGTGHGSASRSIFPEVRVGRVSTSASRGTRGVGSRSRSAATDSSSQSRHQQRRIRPAGCCPTRCGGPRPLPR